jgi:Icc protein
VVSGILFDAMTREAMFRVAARMASASIRVLQITDLHILPVEGAAIYGADSSASLRAVLDVACALPEPPTLIIATGDLSEDGSAASYLRLREMLIETGLPTYVLPGNHDDVAQMHRALLGERSKRAR